MKRKPEEYLDSNIYGEDEDIRCFKEKVVKCRKPHKCVGGCDSEIEVGEYALMQSGFMDSEPVSCYTCMKCMDEWLDETDPMDDEEARE